jgi:hypothetical protein
MKHLPLSCLLALSACTTPDVTEQIKAASDLATTSTAKFRPALQSQAKKDVRQAEKQLIAQRATVYSLRDCESTDDFGIMSDCRLVTAVNLSAEPASASQALAAFDAVEGYFAALLALASSQSSDAVRQEATALTAALKDAQQAKYAPMARLASHGAKHADQAAAVTGFLASQVRIATLRRIVRQADPEIATILETVAAHLDLKSDLGTHHAALITAQGDMEDAQLSGNTTLYRSNLDTLKQLHAAFIKAQNASAGNSFRLLRKLHGDLRKRLNAPGDTSEILATVTEIRSVVDTLRKKDG